MSAAILPGELKHNVDLRLACGGMDAIASRMILDSEDARAIPGVPGRAMLSAAGTARMVQLAYLGDPDDPDADAAARDEAAPWFPPRLVPADDVTVTLDDDEDDEARTAPLAADEGAGNPTPAHTPNGAQTATEGRRRRASA